MTAAARRKRRTGAKTDQIDASGDRQDSSPRTRSVGPAVRRSQPRRRLFGIGYRRELLGERAMALNHLHGDMEKLRSGYHTEITSPGSVKGLNQAARMLRDDKSARARVLRSRITRIRALNRQTGDLAAKKPHERSKHQARH